MVEPRPDMSRIAVESGSETPKPKPERLSPAEGAYFAERRKMEEKMFEDAAKAEEEALRIAAGLKRDWKKPLIRAVEPPSPEVQVWGGLGLLGVGSIGPGIKKLGKNIGLWWDDLFTWVERSGDKLLKPLSFLFSPAEKSLREKEEADKKKKEQEAKHNKKEGEKIKALKDKGISEDMAKILVQGTTPDEKEPEAPETPKEEKAA